MRKFQILGPGCMNCKKLAENTAAAARELDIPCEIEKVTDVEAMVRAGIRRTPALVADGRILVEGRVPSTDELMSLLAQLIA